jgi:hypothetical protein
LLSLQRLSQVVRLAGMSAYLEAPPHINLDGPVSAGAAAGAAAGGGPAVGAVAAADGWENEEDEDEAEDEEAPRMGVAAGDCAAPNLVEQARAGICGPASEPPPHSNFNSSANPPPHSNFNSNSSANHSRSRVAPAGCHIYVCPQHVSKFHPRFDRALARILLEDPLAQVRKCLCVIV